MLKKRKSKLTDLFPERESLRNQPLKVKIKTNTIKQNGNIKNSNSERI